jgi:recombination protein RecT
MTTMQQGSTTDLADRVAARAIVPADGDETLVVAVKKERASFEQALKGMTLSAERFERIVLTEIRKTPKLMECSKASFLGAVTVAAQMGLEFGPLGLAYLVPFYNKKERRLDCQLILGYRGYLDLARRSGDIKSIVARPVYERDTFRFWSDEDGDHLTHEPWLEEDRGEIVRYYGRAVFTNGGNHVQVMSLADIAARRGRSQTAGSGYSPWDTDPIPMSCKTVIRAMVPWLPLTSEVGEGIAADERVVNLRGADLVIEPPALPESSHGQLADPERAEIEGDLDNALAALAPADKHSCSVHLLEKYGPAPQCTVAQLKEAVVVAENWPPPAPAAAPAAPENPEGWEDPDNRPEAQETAPVAQTAPVAPAKAEVIPASFLAELRAMVDESVPDSLLSSTIDAVLLLKPPQIVRALTERNIAVAIKLDDKRLRLMAALVEESVSQTTGEPF